MTLFLGVVLGAVLLGVVLAALSRWGRQADVLDWDPTARIARRAASEHEEIEIGLAEHNARRAAEGLPPEDAHELQQRLARERRR